MEAFVSISMHMIAFQGMIPRNNMVTNVIPVGM
jgi:hypothetical protein